ncbi:MAG: hypothetical protein ACI4SL_01090 [Candidatus Ornithospirochaeta sp.]
MKTKIAAFLLLIISICLIGCSPDLSVPKNPKVPKYVEDLSVRIDVDRSIDFDTVTVEDRLMSLKDDVITSTSKTYSKEDVISEYGVNYLVHQCDYFGYHKLVASFTKNGEVVGTRVVRVITTSDEYNIASLVATMPVTDYTLMAVNADYSEPYFDSSIPTVIDIERNWSYSWENLPEGMYKNPFVSQSAYESSSTQSYWENEKNVAEYVDYLYYLNPDSKFNLFINDYWPELFFDFIDTNVPINHMKFVFISDGTATFNVFKGAYDLSGEDTSLARYEELTNTWNIVKEAILRGERENLESLLPSKSHALRDYIQVMINDPNIEVYWIVNNNSAGNYGNLASFTDKVLTSSHFVKVDLKSMLDSLSSEEKTVLSKLYSFDNTELNKAIEEGKTPIIFLGTSTSGEDSLEGFVKIMKYLLGDSYAYLYKGHPGHITNDSGRREKVLSNNGYIMLDASIPAELVAYFNPDADIAGYNGSSFNGYTKNIPFLCFNNAFSGTYATYCENYAVYADGKYLIVKDRLTENPKHTTWDGKSSFGSLVWEDGDPNA